MIIKRVVVQGFKTYAKKTSFIFDPGITAVVGPNGSGKSNVADAIRWCLGEQSFSLLRSKKTSDVIFSGSDRKTRLGVAQVTVTLDNEDGELPVDFSEVEITRRAYRDGNNEYMLNGQRVRLQDITEILAPTGLGKRTYALIGQGLIERVLSMTPEELRTLFEEAAGITTQQSKRTTALRRLDDARMNLTRVKDITAEISPRLAHLQRQAERTEQRNEVAENLRELLEDWYGYHWHRSLGQLETTSASAEQIERNVADFRHGLDELSAQIAGHRVQQATLRAELSTLHSTSSAHHHELDQVGRQLAVAQERLRQMVARIEAAQQELPPLRVERETLLARITDSRKLLERLREDAALRRSNVDALQKKLSEVQDARRKLEHQLEQRRARVTELSTAQAQAQSRARQLVERSDELRAELEEAQAQKAKASQESTLLNRRLDEMSRERQEIDASQSNVQTAREAAHAELQELRARLNDAVEQRQLSDREVDRLTTRLDVLRRLQNEGAGYANGVRAVLNQANLGKLDGMIGTIASVLSFPAELDRAIDTALGGALQNIVARSWDDARRAIAYLTESRNGRATFLPLDRLNVLPRISAPDAPGVLGNAADLVSYDEEVSKAVVQLLGRVWIAQDLASARSALDALRSGPRPTVVTLGGEIIRPGGAVSGGTDGRRRDDSILAREREMRELPDRLESAVQDAKQRAAECNGWIADIESAQQRVDRLEEQLAELTRRQQEKNSELSDLKSEYERTVQASQWHADREGEVRQELSLTESQIEALASRQSETGKLLDEAEAAFAAVQDSASADGSDSVQQKLADARTAAAELQGEMQSHTAVLTSQQRNLESVETQISRRERQIALLEADSSSLRTAIDELRARENEAAARTAAVQAEIDPAETTLRQLEKEQSKLEERERAVQASLRKSETEWNAAQLAMQRAEDAVSRLQRDILQEFNLVFVDGTETDEETATLPWESIAPRLEPLESLPEALDEQVQTMRRRLSRLKNVNPNAPQEYAEASERVGFLDAQATDLEAAIADLHEVIARLDTLMESQLRETFDSVAKQFVHYFEMLFGGGAAELSLTDPENATESGVEIVARPPGKRPTSLALLSGGERTLAACALIFAILRVSPTPFCVLDEVDAALDEANVDRFRSALEELSQDTQFILITHNRRTLEGTNAIYGVTMGNDGVSRVISLKLEGERILRKVGDAGEDDGGGADGASAQGGVSSDAGEYAQM